MGSRLGKTSVLSCYDAHCCQMYPRAHVCVCVWSVCLFVPVCLSLSDSVSLFLSLSLSLCL